MLLSNYRQTIIATNRFKLSGCDFQLSEHKGSCKLIKRSNISGALKNEHTSDRKTLLYIQWDKNELLKNRERGAKAGSPSTTQAMAWYVEGQRKSGVRHRGRMMARFAQQHHQIDEGHTGDSDKQQIIRVALHQH